MAVGDMGKERSKGHSHYKAECFDMKVGSALEMFMMMSIQQSVVACVFFTVVLVMVRFTSQRIGFACDSASLPCSYPASSLLEWTKLHLTLPRLGPRH